MSTAHEETAVLATATADAESWLARWFRQGAEGQAPPEIREFNAAVTALRRLIDARKALRDYVKDDQNAMGNQTERPAAEEIADALGEPDPDGEEAGDPDAMPD